MRSKNFPCRQSEWGQRGECLCTSKDVGLPSDQSQYGAAFKRNIRPTCKEA